MPPIEQTELAGKLVRHPAELKAVVDSVGSAGTVPRSLERAPPAL
jgi:hypothetical protein